MFVYKNRYSILFKAITLVLVCLFIINNSAWAQISDSYSSSNATLAAQSRLKPLFEKYGLGFQYIATVMMAASEIKNLLVTKKAREGALYTEIGSLNSLFHDSAVEIEKQIKTNRFKCSGKEYKYAVFHFKEAQRTINVLFFENHSNLTSDELKELRINDTEKHYLDCPGLEGVWFINPTSPTTAGQDLPSQQRSLKVLLIQPRMKNQQEKPTRHPAALLSLASTLQDKAFLKKYMERSGKVDLIDIDTYAGFDVRILDLQEAPEKFDFANYLRAQKPDVVAISAVTALINDANALAETTKAMLPKSLRIIGGVHVSALPEETMRSSTFDIGVIGEGEETFAELMLNVAAGLKDFSHIDGVVIRNRNGSIRRNNPRKSIMNADEYPIPAKAIGLLNLNGYMGGFMEITDEKEDFFEKAGVLHTSRSCPYGQCRMCASKVVFGEKLHHVKTGRQIFEEIEYMHRTHNINAFYVLDDVFTFSEKRLSNLADLLEASGIKIKLKVMSRADFISQGVVTQLKRLGCVSVAIGVESGDQRLLDEVVNKNISLQKTSEATLLLKQAGIHVRYYMMVGLPNQGWQSVKDSVHFVLDNNPDSIGVAITIPYPGSDLSTDNRILQLADYDYSFHEPEPGRKKGAYAQPPTITNAMSSEDIGEARDLFMRIFEHRNNPQQLKILMETLDRKVQAESAVNGVPVLISTRTFGKTGPSLPILGIGTVWFGRQWPPDNNYYIYPEYEEVKSYLNTAFATIGWNNSMVMVDTAAAYGLSEETIGRYFRERPDLLSKAFVATKWGEEYDISAGKSDTVHSKERLIASAKRSLERLGKMDLLYIHRTSLEVLRNKEVRGEMQRMKDQHYGGLHFIGATISKEDVLETAVMEGLIKGLDVIQMPAVIFLKRPDLIRAIHKEGIAVVVNSPARTGDSRLPNAIYNDLLKHKELSIILTGTRHHLKETMRYCIQKHNLLTVTDQLKIRDEVRRIHNENLEYAPRLAANTVLCHIVAPSILPDGQQGILNRLDSGMRGREYSEKMLELKTDSSKDFVEQVKDTIQRAKETYKEIYGKDYANYTFKFDVACPSLEFVSRIQNELNIPALAFAPQEGEGNMVQVENIMLALRALERSIETENIKSLIDAYAFVTGNKISSSIKDIAEFAKTMLFSMPKINVNELGRINALIEESIKTAA
jgi:anaerobic magnesium-protoporphyrin IX monomethyl ester cyclase